MDSFNLVALRSEGTIDSSAVADMVDVVGRLMFNCGLLEGLSQNLIWELENDWDTIVTLCNEKWSERSDKLKALIKKRVVDQELQAAMKQVITKTQDLMNNFRNPIAHGMMVVKKDDDVVIYVSKLYRDSQTGKIIPVRIHIDPNTREKIRCSKNQAITLQEIREHIDKSADLVAEWNQLWERLPNKKEQS